MFLRMKVECLVLLVRLLHLTHASDVVSGINVIANEKYRHYYPSSGNEVTSPFAMHASLSLLYEGASGSTARAMKEVLHLSSKQETARQYRELMIVFSKEPDVTIKIANKLYVQPTDSIQSNFQLVALNDFRAEIGRVDFSDTENVVDEIHEWVKKKTDEKVEVLMDPEDVNPSTRAMLTGAVYFKGRWGNNVKFDEVTRAFRKTRTQAVNCTYLQSFGEYSVTTSRKLDAQILKLPYVNERYSLVVVLPNDTGGINKLYRKLGKVRVTPYLREFKKVLASVTIPKFKYSGFDKLTWMSKRMGLEEIFDEIKADFSDLLQSSEKMHLTQIWQSIILEVNGESSEVGESSADMASEVRAVSEVVDFVVDHPFIFFITAKLETSNHDMVLFMGKIDAPNE